MQKLILFDFDGTLADTAPDLAATANTMRARRQLPPLAFEKLRPMSSQGARGLLRVALDVHTDDADYPVYRDEFLQLYEENILNSSHLFPGMAELLAIIKQAGYEWGIVTNKVEKLTYPLVEHFGLLDECSVIVGGDTTKNNKPHPEPMFYAANKAGFAPENCVYIGDDERDILAGKAAGMPTLAAAWGYCDAAELPQWQADAIVESASDVWPALQQIWQKTLKSESSQ